MYNICDKYLWRIIFKTYICIYRYIYYTYCIHIYVLQEYVCTYCICKEFTQTHVHQVSDAIQPSHPLSSPCPPAPNPSQHQSLFQ